MSCSNYCGIVLSEQQYRSVETTLDNRRVIFYKGSEINSTLKGSKSEHLWFSLGYETSFLIVVAKVEDAALRHLIASGLLCDLRDTQIPLVSSAIYDLFHALTSGKNERIRLCNNIRNKFSSMTSYRWCGAEYEAIIEENIYNNAIELVGLAQIGQSISTTGSIDGDLPFIGNDRHVLTKYLDVINSDLDSGQKKLSLLIYGLPLNGVDIIYVGASPGEGWQQSLIKRDFKGNVYAYDPSRMIIHESLKGQITLFRRRVESASDLSSALNAISRNGRKFVFIWDVRGEVSGLSPDDRDSVIDREIANLNLILQDDKFRENCIYLQLKINTTRIDRYVLPRVGKFLPQPQTLNRNVYELRYIFYGNMALLNLSDYASFPSDKMEVIFGYLDNLKSEISNDEITDYRIFLNFITGIIRNANYVNEPSLVPIEIEIALFTLNWNSTTDIRRYLSRLSDSNIRILASFFTKLSLEEGEHEFDETLLFENRLYMVFDSRLLVSAKITGLYFFSDEMILPFYGNEIYFSETYLIRATEYELQRDGRIDEYDELRTIYSEMRGCVFPKFPNIFSLSDKIVSPSGHALRMIIEYAKGNASISMFLYKILFNFFSANKKNLRYPEHFIASPNSPSLVPTLNGQVLPERLFLEASVHRIWHSLSEWLIGITVGASIANVPKDTIPRIVSTLEKHISTPKDGDEIFNYKMKIMNGKIENSRYSIRVGIRNEIFDCDKIAQIAKIYPELRKKYDEDPANFHTWLLTTKGSDSLWLRAVMVLRLDKPVRDYIVHKHYIDAVSNKFPSHDLSKTHFLEIILNAIGMISPEYKWAFVLHYWNNAHHPEHEFVKDINPQLFIRLRAFDSLERVIAELKYTYSVYIEQSNRHADYNFDAYEEFVTDLVARRWQKQFPYTRVINGVQLQDIMPYVMKHKNLDIDRIVSLLPKVVPADKYFIKHEVEVRLKTNYPMLYP